MTLSVSCLQTGNKQVVIIYKSHGVAAPIFKNKIVLGDDPIPVWPYGKGDLKGLALEPLYSTAPRSVQECPDKVFYDLLALNEDSRI